MIHLLPKAQPHMTPMLLVLLLRKMAINQWEESNIINDEEFYSDENDEVNESEYLWDSDHGDRLNFAR